jgi:hypothetical protein
MSRNGDLYSEDFYTWSLTTAAAIRNGEWQDLDALVIAEEIESLGRSEHHALQSHLRQLVMHLLKWRYQPSRRQQGRSWATTIVNARSEIADLVERSPGLGPHVEPLLHKAYPTARRLAEIQTRLPLTTFPATCPWTLEQVLDDDFFPEAPIEAR